MNDHFQFKETCNQEITRQGNDPTLKKLTNDWVAKAAEFKYSYHFEWLGRPIIQHPQDIVAMQQLIWEVQPDLIIETGIARGGSLVFSASMLELLACCGGNPDGVVLGIDVDIREHNKAAILAHPMAKRIRMFQGSSISPTVADEVRTFTKGFRKVMVFLDSNHTHEHVLEELKLYAPLVTRGSYCVVFDTIVADMPADAYPDRPWTKTANPKTAVFEFLRLLESSPATGIEGQPLVYQIDKHAENRVMITVAPDGFLQRI
jgi:cephalosporin hydroxylase